MYDVKVFWVLVCEFTVFGDLMYEFKGFSGILCTSLKGFLEGSYVRV